MRHVHEGGGGWLMICMHGPSSRERATSTRHSLHNGNTLRYCTINPRGRYASNLCLPNFCNVLLSVLVVHAAYAYGTYALNVFMFLSTLYVEYGGEMTVLQGSCTFERPRQTNGGSNPAHQTAPVRPAVLTHNQPSALSTSTMTAARTVIRTKWRNHD